MKRLFFIVLSFLLIFSLNVGNENVNSAFAKENESNELPILKVFPFSDSINVPIDSIVKVDLDSSHKNFKRYKDFIEKGKYSAFINDIKVDTTFDTNSNSLIFLGFSLKPNTEYKVSVKFLSEANNNKSKSNMISKTYAFKTSSEGLPTIRHMDDDGNIYTFSSGQDNIIESIILENERQLEIDKLLDPEEKTSILSSPLSVRFNGLSPEAMDEVKVSVKFKEKPYGLVNLHIDEGRAEWMPFITDTLSEEVIFEMKEDFLFVPFVKKDSLASLGLLKDIENLLLGDTAIAAEYNINKMFNIIENNNGRFQASLSYLVDHPQTFEFFGNPEYYYKLYKEEEFVHKRDIQSDDLSINENLDTAVYEIRIFEDEVGDFLDDHFWTQEIFLERNPTLLSQNEVNTLAKLYAPVLVYHEDEQFFPISIEELMSAEVPNDIEIRTPSIFDSNNNIPYSRLEEFLSFNGHSSYLIDGGDEVGLNQITGSRENSTIYYSYMERDNRKFINYHFIYAYDPKTVSENRELARHNFDRESITVELATNNKIKNVVISGHLEGQTMNLLGDDYYWDSSRINMPYSEEVPKYENHPIIPVALGAHALFPVSGQYRVDVTGVPFWLDAEDQTGVLRDLTDEDFNQIPIDNVSGRNIILPDSNDVSSNDFNHYSLKELNLSQTSHSNYSSLTFSGDWVDVPGLGNAAFPPFTDKEKSVTNWVDGAHTGWDMNRFEDGSEPRESINDINEYLERYLNIDMETSKISGLIKNAITEEVIENAQIQGFNDDRTPMKNKATSNSEGLYTIKMPSGDGFNLVISKMGYIPLEYQSLSLAENEEKFLETILQIPSEFENLQDGDLKGNVIQADTGSAIGDAELTLRKNFNAKTGDSVVKTTSNTNGEYLFENLTTGYYTMEIVKIGYATNFVNVVVVGGREVVRQVTLSPKLNENEMRIVLEWGASPSDLDSHLIGESNEGGQFHISYSNKRYYEDGRLHAELDLDDTSSYGPETVTIQGMKISNNENGTYQYYVHDYTNRSNNTSDALSKSDAKVKVYTSSGYSEYTVPQNQIGTTWSVFKIINGEITPINHLE